MRHALLICCLISLTVVAQERTVFEGRESLLLSNDKISLTVVPEGGAMAAIVLAADSEKINPLWNPQWIAREAKLNPPTTSYRGHFVCVDGFGPVSAEERAAGLGMHGEAYTLPWQVESYQKQGNTLSASFSVSLPIAQETLKRRYHVVDGESIVWVDSELTSHLGFDRPVFWGEHATVSAPFLEPGRVAVDMPAYKSKTKAHPTPPGPNRQLQSFADFTWPMAPTVDGQMFDMRTAPMKANITDHTTSLLDPSRPIGLSRRFISTRSC